MLNSNQLKDPTLSEAHAERILGGMIRSLDNRHLKAKYSATLASEHQVYRNPAEGSASGKLRKLFFSIAAVAAACLLLLNGANYLSPTTLDVVTTQLAALELEGSRSTPGDATIDRLRSKLKTEFATSDAASAILVAREIVATEGATAEDLYNLGLAQLSGGALTNAVVTFDQLERDAPHYATECQYYAGLALLKAGREAEATLRLRAIPNEGSGRYYRLAQELLATVN